MPTRKMLFGVLTVALSGCVCNIQEEDSEVAKRCTPVQSVLMKNYKLASKVDVVLAGLGLNYERSGVQLTPEQTNQIINADRMCRAVVHHDISDQAWGNYLLESAAASIAAIKRQADRTPKGSQISEDAMSALKAATQETQGMLKEDPSLLNIKNDELMTKVQDQSSKFSALSPQQVDNILSQRFEDISKEYNIEWNKLETSLDKLNIQILGTFGRFDTIESRLAGIEGILAKSPSEKIAVPSDVCVYFSTGATELTWDTERTLGRHILSNDTKHLTVNVDAYSDIRGNDKSNTALSFSRANAVAKFLRDRGVTVQRLSWHGGTSNFGLELAKNRVAVIRNIDSQLGSEGDRHCQ